MYALSCLIMPISNAVVERIFSTVTLTKTKLTKRMKLRMLDALSRIKMNLSFEKKCCKHFIVIPKMLDSFNKQTYYNANMERRKCFRRFGIVLHWWLWVLRSICHLVMHVLKLWWLITANWIFLWLDLAFLWPGLAFLWLTLAFFTRSSFFGEDRLVTLLLRSLYAQFVVSRK